MQMPLNLIDGIIYGTASGLVTSGTKPYGVTPYGVTRPQSVKTDAIILFYPRLLLFKQDCTNHSSHNGVIKCLVMQFAYVPWKAVKSIWYIYSD